MTSLPPAVQQALALVRQAPTAERQVVFDADGTLWAGDVGESLLRELIALKKIKASFLHYMRMHERDPLRAYAWAVEVMRGLRQSELEALCQRMVERDFAQQVFEWVPMLLEELQALGARVWVCSASPVWPVRAGARLLAIAPNRVIGVTCPVENDRLTGVVHQAVTAGLGKVQALRRRKVRPLLAVGNGDLDQPMLEHAAHQLVVAPASGPVNALVRTARARSWLIVKGSG